jgi:hypothetical protein
MTITLHTASALMISRPGRSRNICSRISIGSSVRRNVDGDIALGFVEVKAARAQSEVSWWSAITHGKSAEARSLKFIVFSRSPPRKCFCSIGRRGAIQHGLSQPSPPLQAHAVATLNFSQRNANSASVYPPSSLFHYALYCPSKVYRYSCLERLHAFTV